MAVHFVPLLPALIQQRQLEERPHVGSLAGQGNEEGHVRRIVLDALPVRVEIDRPLVPADGERVGGLVLADPDPLGQRVPVDLEVMGAIDGVGDRRRGGGDGGERRGGRRRGLRGVVRHLSHTRNSANRGSDPAKPRRIQTRRNWGRTGTAAAREEKGEGDLGIGRGSPRFRLQFGGANGDRREGGREESGRRGNLGFGIGDFRKEGGIFG